ASSDSSATAMFSIIAIAGKTSRISAASSGWRSMYSLSGGRSPLRYRSRNSSAGSMTRPEFGSDDAMTRHLFLRVRESSNLRQYILQAFDSAEVAAAGAGLGHAQHLGDFAGR